MDGLYLVVCQLPKIDPVGINHLLSQHGNYDTEYRRIIVLFNAYHSLLLTARALVPEILGCLKSCAGNVRAIYSSDMSIL
jgi:hypothetical protein